MSVKSIVDGKIAENKVMVFSKTYCPFCDKAKREFDKLIGAGKLSANNYDVIEIDERPDGDDLQQYLLELTGARTVPRVFINGKCIGGGDETVSAARNGTLATMVQ